MQLEAADLAAEATNARLREMLAEQQEAARQIQAALENLRAMSHGRLARRPTQEGPGD